MTPCTRNIFIRSTIARFALHADPNTQHIRNQAFAFVHLYVVLYHTIHYADTSLWYTFYCVLCWFCWRTAPKDDRGKSIPMNMCCWGVCCDKHKSECSHARKRVFYLARHTHAELASTFYRARVVMLHVHYSSSILWHVWSRFGVSGSFFFRNAKCGCGMFAINRCIELIAQKHTNIIPQTSGHEYRLRNPTSFLCRIYRRVVFAYAHRNFKNFNRCAL